MISRKFFISVCLIWSFLAASVHAATIKEVAEYLRSGQFDEAFEALQILSRQDHPEAQFLMGMMYRYGRGTEQDLAKAAKWYEKSAAQGNSAAMTNLALLYIAGQGVEKDPSKAVSLLQKAVAKGHTSAKHNLAVRYARGEGVEKDLQKAFELYREAASENNPVAQYSLSYAYATGEGTQVDNIEALKWAHLSANRGLQNAIVFYSFLASKATPEEIERATAEAQKFATANSIELKPVPKVSVKRGVEGETVDDAANAPAEDAATPVE